MYGVLLRRVGFWLLVAAILLALAPSVLGESAHGVLAKGMSSAGPLAVVGVVLALLGWLSESVGLSARKCQRCDRHAAKGSVFCNVHRHELSRAGREAAEHYRRDHRSW
jgi:hypothetical protein